jgi:hypothetical protein
MLGCDPHAQTTDDRRGYQRRQPENSVFYQVVQQHIQTLFAQAEADSEHGFGYPRHVVREFERFLSCGVLAA